MFKCIVTHTIGNGGTSRYLFVGSASQNTPRLGSLTNYSGALFAVIILAPFYAHVGIGPRSHLQLLEPTWPCCHLSGSIEVGDLLVSVKPVTVSVEDLLTSDLNCCDSRTVEECTRYRSQRSWIQDGKEIGNK